MLRHGASSAVVLNVDDRASSLYARERYLRSWGYVVENASTGKAALEMAERLLPQLIMLDVHLPDINGIEVCRRLKENPLLKDIPIIIVSATMRGHAANLESIRWGGADAFIAEPFEPGELQSTLLHLTARAT
jgi:CheY-like chemotaxis protein